MADDERMMVLGEDVQMLRRNLAVRFGLRRVRNTPISESAFLGAAVAAAMAGLRPIAEVMLIDFAGSRPGQQSRPSILWVLQHAGQSPHCGGAWNWGGTSIPRSSRYFLMLGAM